MDAGRGEDVLGGPAAAMAAALAAEVVATVARRSRGGWRDAAGVAAQAAALRARCASLAELDVQAFDEAVATLERGEGELRPRLERAAEVPMEIARAAADVAELAAVVADRVDASLWADAVVAALLAEAAARAASSLVAVNLVVTADDERLVHARSHERAASDAARRASAAQA